MTDTLQQLLDIVFDATLGDVIIGMSAPDEWFVMAYWRQCYDDAEYEIQVTSDTLRGALLAVIAHPKFNQ